MLATLDKKKAATVILLMQQYLYSIKICKNMGMICYRLLEGIIVVSFKEKSIKITHLQFQICKNLLKIGS